MMRWEDERWAKLYTRDTPAWTVVPWQARALLPLVIRKMPPHGDEIDLGADGIDALAAVVGLPVEVVQIGLEAWLKRGTLVLDGTVLRMPTHLSAQEAVSSNAKRCREYRATRKVSGANRATQNVSSPTRDMSEPTRDACRATRDDTLRGEEIRSEEIRSPQSPPAGGGPWSAESEKKPETETKSGEGAAAPEPPRLHLPRHVAAVNEKFWVESYKRGVKKVTGNGYTFPHNAEFRAFDTLADIVNDHCPDKSRAEEWIEEQVERFVRWTGGQRDYKLGLGPKGLLAFLNENGASKTRPTQPQNVDRPVRVKQPPKSPEETPATPEEVIAFCKMGIETLKRGSSDAVWCRKHGLRPCDCPDRGAETQTATEEPKAAGGAT